MVSNGCRSLNFSLSCDVGPQGIKLASGRRKHLDTLVLYSAECVCVCVCLPWSRYPQWRWSSRLERLHLWSEPADRSSQHLNPPPASPETQTDSQKENGLGWYKSRPRVCACVFEVWEGNGSAENLSTNTQEFRQHTHTLPKLPSTEETERCTHSSGREQIVQTKSAREREREVGPTVCLSPIRQHKLCSLWYHLIC